MSLIEGATDFIFGSDEERQAIEQSRQRGGALGAIGDVLSSTPDVLGGALQTAVGFGGIGDAAQWLGNVTGRDPFTGRKLSWAERGLGVAALFGFMSAGKAFAHLQGQHILHSGFTGLRHTDWDLQRELRGLERFRPRSIEPLPEETFSNLRLSGGQRLLPNPALRPVTELARLNIDVEDSQSAWGMFRWRDTSNFLRTSPDPDTAWARTATIVARDSEDPFVLNRTDAFVRAMGDRYRNETFLHADLHGTKMLQGADAERAAAHITSYEMARWNAAVQRGLLDGKEFKKAVASWEKLRSGQELKPGELAQLSQAMLRFSNAVWWADHPELTTTPMATLQKINIDDGEPKFDIAYKQFDAVPIDRATWKDVNQRLSQLFQPDPAAMVPLMTQNIVDFYKRFVTDDVVRYYRTWYPDARRKTEAAARAVGMGDDFERFIVLTAITSPSQSWDSNVPKAQAFIRGYRDYKRGKFASLQELGDALREGRYGNMAVVVDGQGFMLPQSTVVAGALIMESSNPWRYFQGGRTGKGTLRLDELGQRFEAGESADELIEMRFNDPDQSLKVPSFTYGIARSDPDDLKDQAHYMARLMQGGFFRDEVADEDVFRGLRTALPVVVDRQAFKVPLGFSVTPNTFLSGQKGVFDAMAQAYRNAALELGVVDNLNRHFLPEELQAIAWIQYRILGQVRFDPDELPDGFPMPPRRSEFMPNWRKPPMRPHYVASFEEGHGPQLMWTSNVWDMINGHVDVLPFSGVDAVDWQLDPSRFRSSPTDLNVGLSSPRTKSDSWRTVHVHVSPDGSMRVLSDTRPTIREGALRTRFPLVGKIRHTDDLPEEQVWLQVQPVPVRNARTLYDRLNESTRSVENPLEQTATGARYYPGGAPDVWVRQGHHMMLNTSAYRGDQLHGVNAHRQLLAELRAHGIKADLETPRPHHGLTRPPVVEGGIAPDVAMWAPDEVMQSGIFSFEDPEQMREAWRYTREQAERLYGEIVLDASFYTDSAAVAPDGTVPVLEHHFRDAHGDEVVNLNVAGDQYWSNSTVVYLPEEFAEFVTPNRTGALDPGTPFHFFDEWVRAAQPADVEVQTTGNNANGPFSLFKVRSESGSWRNADRIAISFDTSPPSVAVGVDDVAETPPGTSIVARRSKRKNKANENQGYTRIELPVTDGEASMVDATMATELLRRLGLQGPIEYAAREAQQ